MRRALARALGIGAAVVAAVAGTVGYFAFQQLHPALPPNVAQLGGTQVTNEAGRSIPLREAVAPGAATIVAFWATWCGPCRLEAAELVKIRRRYPGDRLSIAYLNVDENPNSAATAKFLHAAHADGFPVLYAGRAGWQAITGQRTVALPRAYVFDRSGRALAAFAGFGGPSSVGELDGRVAEAVR